MKERELVLPPNHSIHFWVDEKGDLVAQVEGVAGHGCEGLLDILTEISVVEHEEHTPDWDKPEPQGRKPVSKHVVQY